MFHRSNYYTYERKGFTTGIQTPMLNDIIESIDMNMNVFVRTVRRREIKPRLWYGVGVSRDIE